MKTYIVVEKDKDRNILEAVLSAAELANVEFRIAKTRQRLSSIAVPLLGRHNSPVLLIADADTTDLELVAERRSWIAIYTEGFARVLPHCILMATPQLDAIVFEPKLLTSLLGSPPPEWLLVMARYCPRDALGEIAKLMGREITAAEIAATASPAELETIRAHPIVREITEFLDRARLYIEPRNNPQRLPQLASTHA